MKKYSLITAVISAVIIFSFVAGCGGDGGGGTSILPTATPSTNPTYNPTTNPTYSGTRLWTYMVYMGADNNLSDAGVSDLAEMASVGSSSNVAIVVQAEFSPKYTSGVTTDTLRYYVTKNTTPDSYQANLGSVDMTDPNTLTNFILWTKQNYPAQHYALVLWDHGAGWKKGEGNLFSKGAIQDSTNAGNELMSLPNLAKAVKNSGVHFDIIDFDACLMAMYEVAYEYKGLTDYMVFSEETEPGDGNPYNTILADLSQEPSMTARNFSIVHVNRYNEYYMNSRSDTTLSSVDMSKIDELDTKVRALGNALMADTTTKSIVQAAQDNTQYYEYPENHDIYDFCNYLNTHLGSGSAKTAAQDLMSFIPTIVVANKTTQTNVANSHGLAIYMPKSSQIGSSDLSNYGILACNQARTSGAGTWGAYVDNFINGSGGGSATYGTGKFGVYLQWSNDSDLDLYVGEPQTDGSEPELYSPWMGQSSPNGYFSADSSDSGKSVEYYVAKNQVYTGNYYFLVKYYEDGSYTSTSANVSIIDPENGINSWKQIATYTMSLDDVVDIPQYYNVASSEGGFYALSSAGITGKQRQLIISYKKGEIRVIK